MSESEPTDEEVTEAVDHLISWAQGRSWTLEDDGLSQRLANVSVCIRCGKRTAGWFHSDYMLTSEGLICLDCAFPDRR